MEHTRRHAKTKLGGYQDLRVWQVAVDLATECYIRTAHFPDRERFGLISQMRRASVSVVSNIAEGHGRDATGAFVNHLSIARGSTKELEAQAVLAVRLGFVAEHEIADLLQLCNTTARMLHALRKALRRGTPDPRPPTPDAVTE